MARIYTIGYDGGLTPERLTEIAQALGAGIIDVRSVPSSRIGGWSRGPLRAYLNARGVLYSWMGDELGGRGAGPTEAGIVILARIARSQIAKPRILVCKEEAPGDCHRHDRIAVPLGAMGIGVIHIYRGECAYARHVEEAIRSPDPDADYPCWELAKEMGAIR